MGMRDSLPRSSKKTVSRHWKHFPLQNLVPDTHLSSSHLVKMSSRSANSSTWKLSIIIARVKARAQETGDRAGECSEKANILKMVLAIFKSWQTLVKYS